MRANTIKLNQVHSLPDSFSSRRAQNISILSDFILWHKWICRHQYMSTHGANTPVFIPKYPVFAHCFYPLYKVKLGRLQKATRQKQNKLVLLTIQPSGLWVKCKYVSNHKSCLAFNIVWKAKLVLKVEQKQCYRWVSTLQHCLGFGRTALRSFYWRP